ncbi:hypothetical protein F2Q70_00004028 [Brassica cretica]|uniref:Uncharacterized protein n=1 Tax=Brassica cretica TaxID=69181 RepID=A0A8S9J2L1_BRACR|nr:hypothetical protein F2Q70_00004028 [Brassica cretica]
MSADDLNNQQTRDGDAVDDNVGSTPAANVTAVNLNTAAFEEVQKMFPNFEKKSEERDKVMSSLATQVENLTARTRDVLPRGTTRIRRRKLNFATPLDSQSEPTDEDANVNLRQTRSHAAKYDSQVDNPMTEEEEAIFWDE